MILVNVFGGIVNTANVARGIIKACQAINLELPVVIRLEGEVSHKSSINYNQTSVLCIFTFTRKIDRNLKDYDFEP